MFAIDERWEARHSLGDGTWATIRLVRPSDKPLFERAMTEFSSDVMARRFFGTKSAFTDAELRYLTEVDGFDHLALVAVSKDSEGQCQGLGAARFVRDQEEPTCAEFAVIVGDRWQRCGLGLALLRYLVIAAMERGVLSFRADILSDNSPAFRLIDRLAEDAQWLTDGIVAVVEFELAQVSDGEDVSLWNC